MTTDDSTGPTAAAPEETIAGRSRRPTLRRVALGTSIAVTALLLVVAVAAFFVHVPYVITSPGEAVPLADRVVQVDGAPTYRHRGRLLFLTVTQSNHDPNLYRWIFARLDPDADVERRSNVIGCSTFSESARLNELLMDESQQSASAAALRRLGYDVPKIESRPIVMAVECGTGAQGRLQLGDAILAVDGRPVRQADEIRPLVLQRRPGDVLPIRVRRDGVTRTVRVRLGKRDGAPLVGILTQDAPRFDLPLDVRIDPRRVSGPSAGLSFALAILDDLTPGSLTGGKRVAVTGTIEPDGRVGAVGAVEQKIVAARRAGAQLVLVPAEDAPAARRRAGTTTVVAVRTLDDALDALRRAGGRGVPEPVAAPQ